MPHLVTITGAYTVPFMSRPVLPCASGHKPSEAFASVCFLTVLELKGLILPDNVFMYLVKELIIPFCFPLWGVCVCVCVYLHQKRTMPFNKYKDLFLHNHPLFLYTASLLFLLILLLNSTFSGFSWILSVL